MVIVVGPTIVKSDGKGSAFGQRLAREPVAQGKRLMAFAQPEEQAAEIACIYGQILHGRGWGGVIGANAVKGQDDQPVRMLTAEAAGCVAGPGQQTFNERAHGPV